MPPPSISTKKWWRHGAGGLHRVELGPIPAPTPCWRASANPFAPRISRAPIHSRRHQIYDCHTFVLGALEETAEEVQQTLSFVESLNPDVAVFIVFMEDREAVAVSRAKHRDAILAFSARKRRATRAGWCRSSDSFGKKIHRYIERRNLKGPTWLHLARARRSGGTGFGEG